MTVGALIATIVNMNQPGRYLHWSIFTISVANLVIIAVMVVIFGLALLLPFPKGKNENDELNNPHIPPDIDSVLRPHTDSSDSKMWTARVRNFGLRILPPGKLLPDRQPAYVSS